MLLYAFSGTAVLLGMAGLVLLTAVSVFFLRRRKLGFDPLRITTPAHRFALFAALAFSFLAMNWARSQGQGPYRAGYTIDEDLFTEIEIPPTATPPPPPPPPPPPVIEPVAEAEIEEEPEEFVDMAINEDDAVLETPPAEVVAPAPAPPPPPPPPAPREPEIEELLVVAEQMPVFGTDCKELPVADRRACSDRALLTFVQSHIRYPALARENGIQGTVVVSFVVEKDGTISGLQPVRELPAGCTEEALDAIEAINEEGQTFLPGRQNGMPVRVQFNLPVRFRLN